MPQSVILPRMAPRELVIDRFAAFLRGLPLDKAWRIETHEHKPTRSQAQNNLLWSLYGQILAKGGEAMGGWRKEELHEFFLLNHFGGEVHELWGRKKLKPKRRSSNLSKIEFADLIASIERFMAQQGVYLDMPGDMTHD